MQYTKIQLQQFKILFSWADEQKVPFDILPRNKNELLSLRELNLHSKNIKYIPSEIKLLQNLERFYVSDNNLVSLPKEIGSLKNLQILWIQGNNIKVLPIEILDLCLLEELVAFNNNIEVLPSRIGDMPNLKALFLHNNNLSKSYIETELYPLKSELELSIYNQRIVHSYEELSNLFLVGSENDILIDEDDLKTVMSHPGVNLVLNAAYIGDDAAYKSLEIAIQSQKDTSINIDLTKSVIVQFIVNPKYPIMDISWAINQLHENFNNPDILFCTLTDENLSVNYAAANVLLTGI